MACVFLLGPKTSYGQSEQNPAFWMQLLLFMKATGSKVSWHDPTVDQPKFRYLTAGDWRGWVRFMMSFVINGVGFHILVHALPLQVAGQNSLTGVVFRAVGMLYLVDLDDTPGYTLTFTDAEDEAAKKLDDSTDEGQDSPVDSDRIPETLQGEAERIIQEARAKLDALAAGASVSGYGGGDGNGRLINLSGGMALAAAGGVAGASTANKQKNKKEEDTENDAAGEQGAAGGA